MDRLLAVEKPYLNPVCHEQVYIKPELTSSILFLMNFSITLVRWEKIAIGLVSSSDAPVYPFFYMRINLVVFR